MILVPSAAHLTPHAQWHGKYGRACLPPIIMPVACSGPLAVYACRLRLIMTFSSGFVLGNITRHGECAVQARAAAGRLLVGGGGWHEDAGLQRQPALGHRLHRPGAPLLACYFDSCYRMPARCMLKTLPHASSRTPLSLLRRPAHILSRQHAHNKLCPVCLLCPSMRPVVACLHAFSPRMGANDFKKWHQRWMVGNCDHLGSPARLYAHGSISCWHRSFS